MVHQQANIVLGQFVKRGTLWNDPPQKGMIVFNGSLLIRSVRITVKDSCSSFSLWIQFNRGRLSKLAAIIGQAEEWEQRTEQYNESDAGIWFDEVSFGSIIMYEIIDNKITASILGAASPSVFPVNAFIKYGSDLQVILLKSLSKTDLKKYDERAAL